MVNSYFTPKKCRTIEHNIKIIFSKKGLYLSLTPAERLEMGLLPPSIGGDGLGTPLTEQGKESLGIITDLFLQSKELSQFITKPELASLVRRKLGDYLDESAIPCVQDFVSSIINEKEKLLNNYTFLYVLSGVEWDDTAKVRLGTSYIGRFHPEELAPKDWRDGARGFNRFEETTVITVSCFGSFEFSKQETIDKAKLDLSLLAIYTCLISPASISRVKLILKVDSLINLSGGDSLCWTDQEKSLTFNSWKASETLTLKTEVIEKMKEKIPYDHIIAKSESLERSDLDERLLTAIRWFGEAQNDAWNPGKWVKLWSCLETLFTQGNDNINESNARGVASLLLYGPANYPKETIYPELKKKLKGYYDLRSRCVHHGKYSDVTDSVLTDFAEIVSWVLMSAIMISNCGCSTLAELNQRIIDLDKSEGGVGAKQQMDK